MRIRSRLLLLVSTVVLPAIGGSAIALAYIYKEEQDFNYASMRETASAMALALDREIARRESILQALGNAPSLISGDIASFYRYAVDVARDTKSFIILSDLDGQQIMNTSLPFGGRMPRMLPIEREFRARHGSEPTFITDLYPAPITYGYNWGLEIPVRRDSRVVLFLSMVSKASEMQKLLMEQRLPAGWLATILDGQGVVVARSLEPEKFFAKPMGRELAAKITAGPQGVHEGTTLAGVPSTVFFARAPASRWVFLLSVPHAELYGAAYRATALLAAVSLLMLGLGLAAALFVARRISRPVESLRDAAQRLGHNEPVDVQPSGTLELDDVGKVMVHASDRLRNATAELERRVAEAVASFEQSQRELLQAQKLEALGRLTGGIAHDFNNVLQTLTATLQTLQRAAPADPRDLLARCQRAVARGTELTHQLMAFGRVQDVRVETIATASRLTEARQLLGGALPANVRFDYDLKPGLWPVTVDPAQLELALLNLIMNARDAMPAGGRMVLGARNEVVHTDRADLPAAEYVRLSLSDTGEGMSEEVMARALEPFYTTKGVGRGSGMGLPQAYGFARQNGGTLVLESRKGQGTTVTMYLPRASRPVAAPRLAPAAAAPGPAAGTGTVLLVEDDDDVRETMSSALRAAGFDIQTAATADEALRRILGGARYDAVLTDVVMPGALSGLDLARQIRGRFPRIGVVVVTGYSNRAVQLPGVRALPKPYDLQEAVEALNAAMAG